MNDDVNTYKNLLSTEKSSWYLPRDFTCIPVFMLLDGTLYASKGYTNIVTNPSFYKRDLHARYAGATVSVSLWE